MSAPPMMADWKSKLKKRLRRFNDDDPKYDAAYLTTAAAALSLGIDHKKLWRLAKKHGLSPRAESARCVYWRRDEIEALAATPALPHDVDLISRRQAAEKLCVCPETVSRMVTDGRLLEPVRRNGRVYFRTADVERLSDKRDYDCKMSILEAADYIGIAWFDLRRLIKARLFPQPYYSDGRFRHGDVRAWWVAYCTAGNPTANPEKTAFINSLQPDWVYKKISGLSL